MCRGITKPLNHPKSFNQNVSNIVLIKMSYGQYPFWKDREIAHHSNEASRKQHELEEIKKKLKNVKCPECGHIFDIE